MGHDGNPGGQVGHKEVPDNGGVLDIGMWIFSLLRYNRETGQIISLPEGGRGVGDGAVEVDGEGDHVEEEAGQGPQQGDGGEQERGRGTPG